MEQVNVAIADDNERILDLLEEIINMDKELHVVGKAKNGEEMCQIIRNKQPDVVLLDLIMPKMDGLTVMEKINQDKNVQKRPDFIVVTAVGQVKNGHQKVSVLVCDIFLFSHWNSILSLPFLSFLLHCPEYFSSPERRRADAPARPQKHPHPTGKCLFLSSSDPSVFESDSEHRQLPQSAEDG